MLRPVYDSQSSSSFAMAARERVVLSRSSGCPTGLWIPSHMPMGPVAAPRHQGWDATHPRSISTSWAALLVCSREDSGNRSANDAGVTWVTGDFVVIRYSNCACVRWIYPVLKHRLWRSSWTHRTVVTAVTIVIFTVSLHEDQQKLDTLDLQLCLSCFRIQIYFILVGQFPYISKISF